MSDTEMNHGAALSSGGAAVEKDMKKQEISNTESHTKVDTEVVLRQKRMVTDERWTPEALHQFLLDFARCFDYPQVEKPHLDNVVQHLLEDCGITKKKDITKVKAEASGGCSKPALWQ